MSQNDRDQLRDSMLFAAVRSYDESLPDCQGGPFVSSRWPVLWLLFSCSFMDHRSSPTAQDPVGIATTPLLLTTALLSGAGLRDCRQDALCAEVIVAANGVLSSQKSRPQSELEDEEKRALGCTVCWRGSSLDRLSRRKVVMIGRSKRHGSSWLFSFLLKAIGDSLPGLLGRC
jgi:hypothetical protein